MSSQPSGSQSSSARTILASASFFGPDGEVVCNKCGKPASRLTSHSVKNPGRLFWKCDPCNFFQWDDKLPPRPGSATPTPSQMNSSLPPATPRASQTVPIPLVTPSSSQHAPRAGLTPSPNKRSAPAEPSSQEVRNKRLATIYNAIRQPDPSQMLATPSSPTPKKFKSVTSPSTTSAASIQPRPIPAPDFGVPVSSRASDAGNTLTIHDNASADDFFGATPHMPSHHTDDHDTELLTPPDTGKTQIIPLPGADNSPLKGKGKAVATGMESDEEWNALDDTMDLDNTQSTLQVSQEQPPAGPSHARTVPSDIDFEPLFKDLARLPDYVRSLKAENARLKEELDREKAKSKKYKIALHAALGDKE
ncbi:unnamed protein product [Peniophora sp. CBMAI 1063]|nr:unnamed protein product [Peniophora sp. CBMAI 1063]